MPANPPTINGVVPHREYAFLTLCSYSPDDEIDLLPESNRSIPEDQRLPAKRWQVFMRSDTEKLTAEGLFAVAYISDELQSVVVAFRGTANAENILADVQLFRGHYPKKMYADAQIFIKRIQLNLTKVKKKSHYIVSVTGHSLGAFLAQLIAWEYYLSAVTFDSPGVFDSSIKLWRDQHCEQGRTQPFAEANLYNYLSEVNVINTTQLQRGILLALSDKKPVISSKIYSTIAFMRNSVLSLPGVSSAKAVSKFFYFTLNLFNEEYGKHCMEAILRSFHESPEAYPSSIKRIKNWPSGLGDYTAWKLGLKLDKHTDLFSLINPTTREIRKSDLPILTDGKSSEFLWNFYYSTLPLLIRHKPKDFTESPYYDSLCQINRLLERQPNNDIMTVVNTPLTAYELQSAMYGLYHQLPQRGIIEFFPSNLSGDEWQSRQREVYGHDTEEQSQLRTDIEKHLSERNYGLALSLIDRGLALMPRDEDLLIKKVIALYDLGHLIQAADTNRQATAQMKGNSSAASLLVERFLSPTLKKAYRNNFYQTLSSHRVLIVLSIAGSGWLLYKYLNRASTYTVAPSSSRLFKIDRAIHKMVGSSAQSMNLTR